MRYSLRQEEAVEKAGEAVRLAESGVRLRQCLAVLIPALTGADLATTARILGVGVETVRELRRSFMAGDARRQRGGRRRALMSLEAERAFVAPWLAAARSGAPLDVAAFRAAYERAVGRAVAKSTLYRLLKRHGWCTDGRVAVAGTPRV